jgi:WD40 repeat protein
MGCGVSRDDSNYHGVTPFRRLNATATLSSTSTSDHDELEVDGVVPVPHELRHKKRKKVREKKAKPKTHRKEDALFNFGDFRVKMVDELIRDESLRSLDHYSSPRGPRKANFGAPSPFTKLRSYHVEILGSHSGRIRMAQLYNNDRRLLSSGGEDAVAIMREDQTEQGRLLGHDDAIVGGCVSDDFRFFATTSRDCTVVLWDIQAQRLLHSLAHPKVVTCASFNSDASLIVTGCQDQLCRVWETRAAREFFNFKEHKGIVLCIKFAPNDAFVASGGSDRRVLLWKYPEPKAQRAFVGHSGAVFGLDICGSLLLSCDETSIILWSTLDGSQLHAFVSKDMGPRCLWMGACFCPSTFSMVVASCSNRSLYVFAADGTEILSLFLRATASVVTRGVTSLAIGDHFGNNYLLKLC